MGPLDGARHELELDVRHLPQHPVPEELRARERCLPFGHGGTKCGLRGLSRADAGSRQLAAGVGGQRQEGSNPEEVDTRGAHGDLRPLPCAAERTYRRRRRRILVLDHYLLAIVDGSDTFYPDGQVREEDYEYTAFLGSRMHAAGVTCLDCHDPHAGRPKLEGDALCMQCHDGRRQGIPGD